MIDTDAIAGSGAHIAQAASRFAWDGHPLEAGVGVAASGGGFRAMLFHAGAFLRLSELEILQRAKRVSSVSGGSIACAYLACVWDKLQRAGFAAFRETFVEPIVAFARERLDILDVLAGLPPGASAGKRLAGSYESLFQKRALGDLPDSVQFVFCATNLQTGVLWRFTKAYAGDYVVGRLASPDIPLSLAVAASSAFPPFLSPLALDMPDGAFTDWPGAAMPLSQAEVAPFRKQVILSDGGVYDNLGVEPLVKRFATVLASDGGAPFARQPEVHGDWVRQLQRVVDVIGNQVGARRRHDLVARLIAGAQIGDEAEIVATNSDARLGAFWGIDTDPEKLQPPKALPCSEGAVRELAAVPTRLANPGEETARRLVNWGYAICDRSVRQNYKGPKAAVDPTWPFPESPLG